MQNNKNLKELKRLAEQLLSLTEDPQTGIMTWWMCLNNVLEEISGYRSKEQV
jgi:sensor domain CHASE-containing protein